MFKFPPSTPKFAHITVRDDETPTQDNLAFDLRDMDDLRERGVPISTSSLVNDYYDGAVGDNFSVPVEHRRGVDINDAWETSKREHEKLTKTRMQSLKNSEV